MNEKSRNNLQNEIMKIISARENGEVEVKLKNTGSFLRITIEFFELNYFIDSDGKKWIRQDG